MKTHCCVDDGKSAALIIRVDASDIKLAFNKYFIDV